MKKFRLKYILNNRVQEIMGHTLNDALNRAALSTNVLLFCTWEEIESCETYRCY